jgi:hypothetical protein
MPIPMFKFQLFAVLFALSSLVACKNSAPDANTTNTTIETTIIPESAPTPAPAPAAPKEFVSEEGQYSITFPGAPTEQRQSIPIEGMGEIEMVAIMYEPSQNKVFMVAHADYPEAMVKAAKKADKNAISAIIDNAKQGAVGQMKLTISTEEKIIIQDNVGISFMADNGNIYTEYQIFLVGNRLYQIAILSQGVAVTKAEATPFFGTFKLN